jgi:hypothetical protein
MPVFRKDHAQSKTWSAMAIQSNPIALQRQKFLPIARQRPAKASENQASGRH